MVLADRDLVDRQALALELASARQVAAPVRDAVAALTTMLLVEAAKAKASSVDGTIPPKAQAQIRTALDTALAALTIDLAVQTTKAIRAAVALAVRQEAPVLTALGLPAANTPAITATVLADPLLADAGHDVTAALADAVARIGQYGATTTLATEQDVQALAARTSSAVSTVEREIRSLTNRAINETTRQIAASPTNLTPPSAPPAPVSGRAPIGGTSGEPPTSVNGRTPLVRSGLVVVWVAERDACLTCLRLSGTVIDPDSGAGFDEDATFGAPGSAPQVWPPGMPLMKPPRHPNCRCRLRIIAADNTMVPDALRREAERAVARGWSASDSRRARLSAADRLLHHGSRLPRTVQERAARDVERGSFSQRHRPRAPHLRDD